MDLLVKTKNLLKNKCIDSVWMYDGRIVSKTLTGKKWTITRVKTITDRYTWSPNFHSCDKVTLWIYAFEIPNITYNIRHQTAFIFAFIKIYSLYRLI